MRVMALLAGIGMLAAAGMAEAAPLTLVETGSMARTDVPTGGLSQTILIDKFDVVGATLTGISVSFQGETYGSVSITRGSTGTFFLASFGNIGLRNDFTLTIAPSTTASLPDVATSVTTLNVARNRTVIAETIPDATPELTFGAATAAAVSVAPGLFSLFTGPGSVSMALNILRDNFAASIPTNAGAYTIAYDNEATAAVQVTYTYTLPEVMVPVPMSAGFLGVGLAGLLAVRSVRRRAV